MSGFIANGPATPSLDSESDQIASCEFWPAVSLAAVQAEMRMDGAIAEPRLRAAVVGAITTVNDELDHFKATQLAQGHTRLSDVPSYHVDGKSRLVMLYLRAIACATAAEITERYRSYDATQTGLQRAEHTTPTIDELRRDQAWAIRAILGRRALLWISSDDRGPSPARGHAGCHLLAPPWRYGRRGGAVLPAESRARRSGNGVAPRSPRDVALPITQCIPCDARRHQSMGLTVAEPAASTLPIVTALSLAALLPGIDADALIGAFAGATLFVVSRADLSIRLRVVYLVISTAIGYMATRDLIAWVPFQSTGLAAFLASAIIVTATLALIEKCKKIDFGWWRNKGDPPMVDPISTISMLLAASICGRLLTYKRPPDARLRRGIGVLAWLVIATTGGLALRILLSGGAGNVGAFTFIGLLILAVLVFRAHGNVASILRRD